MTHTVRWLQMQDEDELERQRKRRRFEIALEQAQRQVEAAVAAEARVTRPVMASSYLSRSRRTQIAASSPAPSGSVGDLCECRNCRENDAHYAEEQERRFNRMLFDMQDRHVVHNADGRTAVVLTGPSRDTLTEILGAADNFMRAGRGWCAPAQPALPPVEKAPPEPDPEPVDKPGQLTKDDRDWLWKHKRLIKEWYETEMRLLRALYAEPSLTRRVQA